MLESLGLPMPGETALIAAGAYAGSAHRIGLLLVVGVAATAAVLGDNLGYLIGRKLGLRLVIKYGSKLHLHKSRLKIGEYLFLKHGGKIVFVGRFVALLRSLAAVLAGANRMPWRSFLVMNALGGICWASLFGGGAYLFGQKIKTVAGPGAILIFCIALCLIVVGIKFFRGNEKLLEARADKALPNTWDR